MVLVELKDLCYPQEGGVFENARAAFLKGECVIVLGPFASGKGALVRMMAGLLTPARGGVYAFGAIIAGEDKSVLYEIRKRMGFVLEETVLISNLKVIENVALPLLYHSDMSYTGSLEKAATLLDFVGYRGGLWDIPGPLSAYQKKKVEVARALSLDPEVIVCENLTHGFGKVEREGLVRPLLEYQAKRSPLVIFTTYLESDINLLSPDRVVRIEGRKLIEDAPRFFTGISKEGRDFGHNHNF